MADMFRQPTSSMAKLLAMHPRNISMTTETRFSIHPRAYIHEVKIKLMLFE